MVDRSRLLNIPLSEIVSAYEIHKSAHKVAKHFGIGSTSVYRMLLKAGVDRIGLEKYRVEARSFNPSQDHEIRSQYDAGILSRDLERKYSVSNYAIKQAIARAGGTMRINPAPKVKSGETEQILALYEGGLSQARISVKLSRTVKFVQKVLYNNGIIYEKRVGANHGSWKGGRSKAEGYWRIKISIDDPLYCMANAGGYVLEHRITMARSLNRPLNDYETVHHIDGNKENNEISNLQLRQGRHGKGTVLCCLNCGSQNIGSTCIAG